MCFRVTLVIMVLLYVGHSMWPDPLPGLIRCRGNSVTGCSRATGAPQAADRVTCQSCLRPQRERMQIEY